MKKIIELILVIFFIENICSVFNRVFNKIYSIRKMRCVKCVCGQTFISYPIKLTGGDYIEIGSNFFCGKNLRLEAIDNYNNTKYTPVIKIGDNVNIQDFCHIGAINKIEIGNNVLVASKVLITDHFHGKSNKSELLIPPVLRNLYSKGPVVIEDNVWIGEGVTILSGVKIGQNSIIGSNSVVTSNIPPFSIAVGSPAKIIKSF